MKASGGKLMFHLDQYANVAREYLASKGIDSKNRKNALYELIHEECVSGG